jgi:hypothetical protein
MNTAYLEYLQSDHWRNLRKAALATWGDRCCNCSIPKVDVHHLRYGNLYDVSTDDLMPLCRRCHDTVHASPRLRELLAGNTESHVKRSLVLGFLAGRDEVITVVVPRTTQREIIAERHFPATAGYGVPRRAAARRVATPEANRTTRQRVPSRASKVRAAGNLSGK